MGSLHTPTDPQHIHHILQLSTVTMLSTHLSLEHALLLALFALRPPHPLHVERCPPTPPLDEGPSLRVHATHPMRCIPSSGGGWCFGCLSLFFFPPLFAPDLYSTGNVLKADR